MKPRLPGWATDPRASLAREVAPYVNMSPEERGALMAAACRDAMRLLAARPDWERVVHHRDPLPESSVRAFARLRREYRERRGR